MEAPPPSQVCWRRAVEEGGALGTRSAAKAHRQSLQRRLRNRAVKSATKTAVKKANDAILSGDLEAARDAVHEAVVALDKAAQKGVLHHNNSARHKSRLLIKYNAAVAVREVSGEASEAEGKTPKKRASTSKKTSKK
ncbi:MAG TPA: 30S ribosomal protein S20 [Dehalococcoidia bacterium]